MPNDGGLKVDPFALAIGGLLYLEHLLFGANRQDLSLFFGVVQLLILAGLMAATKGAEPPRLPLALPSALLGVVFALGLFSILPLGQPLAHPLWTYAPAGAPASISIDPMSTRVELIKLAGLAALFLIGVNFGWDRTRAERFGSYLIFGGILYCVWAFFAWVLAPTTIFGVPRPYGIGRLSGSFYSPNSVATLFACLGVMALTLLLRPFLRVRRLGEKRRLEALVELWPQALLLLLALPCLLFTGSRGGLTAFVATTLAVVGYLAWIRSTRQSLTGGFVAVVCLLLFAGAVVFLISGGQTAERLATVDPLHNDRMQVVAAYWPLIKASPWLGYGLGSFRQLTFGGANEQTAVLMMKLGSAHNVYVQWLLQEGFPGALAMIGCVAVVMAGIARGVARRSTQQALGAACLAVAVVFAVHGVTDFGLEEPSLAAFFAVILGLGFGIAQRPASGKVRR